MKLIFKILGVLLAILILAMIAIPYFFRDQIVEKIKEEINKNVNAKVDFADFDLSLFRSFPDFDFRLEGLSVVNNAPFEGDTLAYIATFGIRLDLLSVLKGENYVLKSITINRPIVNALVEEDGTANWDITIETPAEPDDEKNKEDVSSPFLIKLKSVVVNEARIVYDDKSLLTYALLNGVNHSLSGDFMMDFTSLKTKTSIRELTVIYDGVKYLNKVEANLDALIDADLVNSIYTLKNNDARLNQLYFGFDGSVAMLANGDINLMLTYATKQTDFKNFLSLIPAIYSKDFENIKSSGSASLSGNVKGLYTDVSYPGFELNILVDNGFFQYPDLPKSVEKVNVDTKIAFPGGDLDNLTVDVSKFEMTMAGNQISASLFIKKPMTDIEMKGAINGKVDLSKVKDIYPLDEGDELTGMITSSVSFDGKMSALENEKYQEFIFLGSVLMEDFQYTTAMLPQKVNIKNAQLNFSPEYLDLVNFSLNLGRNTFFAKGRIENFMPYILAEGTLVGNLETSSSYLNIIDLMANDSTAAEATNTSTESNDTTAMGVIEIPVNIDFTLTADYKMVVYDSIELKNLTGKMIVKDKSVSLDNLKMEVIDGMASLSGKYDTKNAAKPSAAFAIGLSNIDIQKAYSTFGTFGKFAPIAEKTTGKFSTNFTMTTLLDPELMPVYSSMNGTGNLQTSQITVENVSSVDKLADLLKMPDLKRLSLSPVNLTFEIIEGKMHVKPFDIKYQDVSANIGGWTSFDQNISYDMVLTVPRSKFGGQANAVLDNLVNEANKLGTNFSLGETVNIKAAITGTVSDPQVKVFPGEGSGKNMVDDLKKKAMEELERQKQKLKEEAGKELEKKKAEARKEADKILADAEIQANKILSDAQIQVDALNKTAQESAEKAKVEGQKQVTKFLEDAKKKGPIAEIAARAAADEMLKEANKNADNIVVETGKQSESIMKTAREQAAKVRSDAKAKADKTIEDI